MPHFMCVTCGTQFADSQTPPANCPICEDERQYVDWNGQQWTTLTALQADHEVTFKDLEPNLTAIAIEPNFGIGQHALLVQTPQGNVLWDCIALLNEDIIAQVNAFGGLSAIAISHPHYYSSMIEWSHTFDAPIHIHTDEREYVMRPDPSVKFWEGETLSLGDNLTLIRCGGHFSGGQVLHWQDGADGKGGLLTGDIIQVVQDRRYVSFMYSYPNYIPLSATKVNRIVSAVEPYAFERIYGAFAGREVLADAKNVVKRSAERYINALQADD